MVDKYNIKLTQSQDVYARIYTVYENDKIILKSTTLEDVNELRLTKHTTLKIIIEPEITGIPLILLLLLQILSSGIDKNFYTSFFYDSIDIQPYLLDKLTINYMYSFHESFSIEGNVVSQQRKVISSKNFYTLFIVMFVPLTLLMTYCITMFLLETNYFMIRLLIILFLCALQIYLSYQLYKLNKFRQPKI